MKKFTTFIITVLSTLSIAYGQVKVGDASLPSTLTYKEQTLNLNGAGIRKKFWFKLYSAGLYLKDKSSNANTIVNSDAPTAIRLHITSSLVSKTKLIGAVRDGFEKTNPNKIVQKLQPKLDTFIGFLDGDIEIDDTYDIIYLPNQGLSISKNGTTKGIIKDLEFKKAIFNIWLAQSPVDEGLKKQLLKI